MAVGVLPPRLLRRAAEKLHPSGAGRTQIAEAARVLPVARAAETKHTAAGTNVKAAGGATAGRNSAKGEGSPAGQASGVMAVRQDTAVAVVESRAVGLLALQVGATMSHARTAAGTHLPPGALMRRSTAMGATGATIDGAELAMRAAS